MDVEIKPLKLRIVSGPTYDVEFLLNELLTDYQAVVWAFAPVGGVMHGTVVLLHNSVLMQRAIAQPGAMRPN